MAVRIRTVSDDAELAAALAAIDHYFGGTWVSAEPARFQRLLPHSRVFAAFEGGSIVAGAGSFPFELTVPGGPVPCAGVTAVGVLPTHRRQGILTRMMRAQIDDARDRGEPLMALWASEETIYRRFGYGLAHLVAFVTAPSRTAELHADLPQLPASTRLLAPEEASVILPPIYERVRRRTPGFISRTQEWWESRILGDAPERRAGAGMLNRLLLELDGRAAGYALYRVRFALGEAGPTSTLRVLEAMADSPDAMRELWRYLLSVDWMEEIECHHLPIDHPLFLLVQRPNALGWKTFDGLWLRLVDVGAALAARSLAGDGRVTFEVASDPLVPENVGTWTMEGGTARRSSRRADVRLDVQALASAYLGGFSFAELARAGRAEEVVRGGIARADGLFRVDAKPWCPENF